ncbi:MAG: Rieske (2Fe-2S) protein [Planctomyces sp.]|nr:Rieske (2Fe-2S) protein [Planctomyces sp.]
MPERVRLCNVNDVPSGGGREFVVGDRIVAVFNVDGTLHALDGICPHAGGPLAKGCLTGTVVTCPWHGWQFDVVTGQHQLTPRIRQPTLPLMIENDDVLIELPS